MDRFRVRVKVAEVEVEVEAADKEYVEAKVRELLLAFGGAAPAARKPAGKPAPVVGIEPNKNGAKPVSMVEHVRSLSPKSGTQYVIAVGQYLEQHGGMADGFKTRDIVAGFQTVRFKHGNPREAVRQAKAQGFLMDAKEPGAMMVTQTGEAWIKGQLADAEDAA